MTDKNGITELEAFLDRLVGRGGNSFTRADLDELLLRANALSDQVPERFLEVIREFDKDFSATTRSQVEFLQRIERIYTLTAKLGLEEVNSAESGELEPIFSLEKKDKDRVLKLSTDMRKIVFASTFFDEPHKRRLLNRIAAIETEVHQKQGKLDVVLAGVVDVGDALGKFGQKVEPLTKRMKEVADLARGGSKQYEQIPPPEEIQALPPPEAAEDE